MPTIWFYFDFACAHAYIALHQLPNVLQGLSWQVRYCPIATNHIPDKAHIAQAQKLATQLQLPFQAPAAYPFDSKQWLLMALAASPHGHPSRYVCSTLFDAIWQHGHNPDSIAIQQQAWQDATALLPHSSDKNTPQAQLQLDENITTARQHGISNTPSFVLHTCTAHKQPQLFVGLDALPQLQAVVQKNQTA